MFALSSLSNLFTASPLFDGCEYGSREGWVVIRTAA